MAQVIARESVGDTTIELRADNAGPDKVTYTVTVIRNGAVASRREFNSRPVADRAMRVEITAARRRS